MTFPPATEGVGHVRSCTPFCPEPAALRRPYFNRFGWRVVRAPCLTSAEGASYGLEFDYDWNHALRMVSPTSRDGARVGGRPFGLV